MTDVLVAWIGRTDLRSAEANGKDGLGPIAQALEWGHYPEVALLSNYPPEETVGFVAWLKARSNAHLSVLQVALSSPTHFGEIFLAACRVCDPLRLKPENRLVFHLSPGTPAMAAVWILLAKTRFPAELIESSKEAGVHRAEVPFDISIDFIPELLKERDQTLLKQGAESPPEAPAFQAILHRSLVMQRLIRRAQRVAPRSIPVLIEGESGTGKEMLARAIHAASPRRDEPFLAVNCGAIPAELVESELFGHEKGAFTGATSSKTGYFEAAQGGTLLLDEIGELPMRTQVKLLRALQESEIVRLGMTRPIPIDVRIIAATNRTLLKEVAAGTFREDLFFRLAVAVLVLPPLRDRGGDISLLIEMLLKQVNRESALELGFQEKRLTASARNLLIEHSWPGNVRELLNTLRRATVWTEGKTIGAEDVRDAILTPTRGELPGSCDAPLGSGFSLQTELDRVAIQYLKKALANSGGSKTRGAALLGLASYQTYQNWLKKYGLA
jgi:transcriptional regulator with PAS, ATPase and Fis domain